MIAYGPSSISSIEELKETGTAFVISDEDNISAKLYELFTTEDIYSKIIDAVRRSQNCETLFCNETVFKTWLERVAIKEND